MSDGVHSIFAARSSVLLSLIIYTFVAAIRILSIECCKHDTDNFHVAAAGKAGKGRHRPLLLLTLNQSFDSGSNITIFNRSIASAAVAAFIIDCPSSNFSRAGSMTAGVSYRKELLFNITRVALTEETFSCGTADYAKGGEVCLCIFNIAFRFWSSK